MENKEKIILLDAVINKQKASAVKTGKRSQVTVSKRLHMQ